MTRAGADVHRFRLRQTGSVEIDGIPHCLSDTALHSDADEEEEDYESDVLALNHNTWSLRCHKEQLSRMLTNGQAEGSNSILSVGLKKVQPSVLGGFYWVFIFWVFLG